ncbi:MAG: S41 family peptidase [Bacillota bacterium]
MYKKIIVLLLVALFSFAGINSAYAGDISKAKDTISEVFDYLLEYHKDNPEFDQLMEGAIWGMIDTLEDPYTVFLANDEVGEFVDTLNGNFKGVGIYLEGQNDYPRVLEVFPDSPAKAAGVMPGDIIIRVNGTDIKGLPLNSIIEKIKGPEGTEVNLLISRDEKELSFKIKRTTLTFTTVNSKVMDKSTGYISVDSFSPKTASEFRSALKSLIIKDITGLVIDLRDNPGGYLEAAVEMAEMLVKPGDLIVKTEYNDGSEEKYIAEKQDLSIKVPIIVVVNSGSASASEVFAGALQDHGIARLVGERTFGKGVVQNVIPLDGGGALKLTTAEYTTPKGRHLNKKGIEPDYLINTGDLQVPFALTLVQPQHQRIIKYTPDSDEVMVNEEKIKVSNRPFSKDKTVYLPLRFTFEALGYMVKWDESTGRILVKKDNDTLQLSVAGYPLYNGRIIKVGRSLYVEDGVSYITPELIGALGFSCEYVENQIVIKSKTGR